jgi:folate-dependent phosphoribosylglycinamide formyltransferase PurN
VKQSRTVVICHHDEPLNRFVLPRWLESFTTLSAVIVIREPQSRLKARIRRELRRIGFLRFLDVLAFRIYYKIALSKTDRQWEDATLNRLLARYPELPATCRILETTSPNSPEVIALLRDIEPDFMLARCKNILKPEVFNAPRCGTYVMHPGICPEYRNAHGCFWALANDDLAHVGMTLLRVDPGVDTGPVFGYYHCNLDEVNESHIIIQSRVVFDNLDALRMKIEEILAGTAHTTDTTGRPSRVWGQPWLTKYWHWKRAAHKRLKHAS